MPLRNLVGNIELGKNYPANLGSVFMGLGTGIFLHWGNMMGRRGILTVALEVDALLPIAIYIRRQRDSI